MEAQTEEKQGTERTRARKRSPSYPLFDLRTAVDRAREFYDQEGLGIANRDVTVGHWGLSHTSSTGMRTVAALLHYDLLVEEGSGSNRQFRLSKLAQNILLNPEFEKRRVALKDAALRPDIFQRVWRTWGERLPSDAQMRFDLETNFEFNRNAIEDFIASFKGSLDFAGITNGGDSAFPKDVSPTDNHVHVSKDREPIPDERTTKDTQQDTKPPPPGDGDSLLEFPLQLVTEGLRAHLRLPSKMTEEDYQVMRSGIDAILTAFKPSLVVRESSGGKKREQ